MQAELYYITNHPIFLALAMGLMNIGGKFLPMDVPPIFEELLKNPIMRKVVWFMVFFVATRDWKTALLWTLVITVVFNYMFNESSTIARLIQKKLVPQ